MTRLFTLTGALPHNPQVEEWLHGEPAALYAIARQCFRRLRDCGDDVTEILHDGCPVACVGGAAFAYVNVFRSHVNLGFYMGSSLRDPEHLLQGSGKWMRHIKIKPDEVSTAPGIERLVLEAYLDIKSRVRQDQ
jgi:hypothetical protein